MRLRHSAIQVTPERCRRKQLTLSRLVVEASILLAA
jgi:hypothetical protein